MEFSVRPENLEWEGDRWKEIRGLENEKEWEFTEYGQIRKQTTTWKAHDNWHVRFSNFRMKVWHTAPLLMNPCLLAILWAFSAPPSLRWTWKWFVYTYNDTCPHSISSVSYTSSISLSSQMSSVRAQNHKETNMYPISGSLLKLFTSCLGRFFLFFLYACAEILITRMDVNGSVNIRRGIGKDFLVWE